MTERGQRGGPEILHADVEAAFRERADLRAQHQGLRSARARPVADEATRRLGGPLPLRMGGEHDEGGEVSHVGGDRDLAHQLAHGEHLGTGQHAPDLDVPHVGGAVDDLGELLESRIADPQLEEEAVELRLRQRVGAFHLDGVLGGEHEEGRGQRVGVAGDGDRPLLHALQQRGLRLRGGPVHLVGEQDVAEDGPALELEVLPRLGVFHDDIGADDVARHQVRRELDAGEGELEALREGLDEKRLAEAGDAFQQHVTAREETDQHLADDVVVADDDLADLGAQRLVGAHELLDSLLLGLTRHGRLRHERLLSRLGIDPS